MGYYLICERKEIFSRFINFLVKMDIRNFFGAKPKTGTEVEKSSEMKKKRPKPVVLSSDSESEDDSKKNLYKNKKPLAKKPARQVLSDSGMAIFKLRVVCFI